MNIIDPLIRDKDCAAILGCSVPTFWRRVADGTIKPPIKMAAHPGGNNTRISRQLSLRLMPSVMPHRKTPTPAGNRGKGLFFSTTEKIYSGLPCLSTEKASK